MVADRSAPGRGLFSRKERRTGDPESRKLASPAVAGVEAWRRTRPGSNWFGVVARPRSGRRWTGRWNPAPRAARWRPLAAARPGSCLVWDAELRQSARRCDRCGPENDAAELFHRHTPMLMSFSARSAQHRLRGSASTFQRASGSCCGVGGDADARPLAPVPWGREPRGGQRTA